MIFKNVLSMSQAPRDIVTHCNTNTHTHKENTTATASQTTFSHTRSTVEHHIVTHPIVDTQTTFVTQDCHIRLRHTHTHTLMFES